MRNSSKRPPIQLRPHHFWTYAYLEFDDSGQLSTKIYDKRDNFNFKIINFPKMCTYRFDIVESNHESPFKDLYVSNTAIHYIQHSPVLAPSCQSQTHDDFVIAQVLQEELGHAKDPEAECLQADIIPGL
jgi:hypothetical protein